MITCHLFRHCPLQDSARTLSDISPLYKDSINPVDNTLNLNVFKLVSLSSELVKTNRFASSLSFLDSSDRFRGAFSVLLREF